MNKGKLVWSQDSHGTWYCHSHDEEFLYTARRFERHLWKVEYRKRKHPLGYQEPIRLGGPVSTLVLAKRRADVHHHAWIRKHGSFEIHDYILRFPLVVFT